MSAVGMVSSRPRFSQKYSLGSYILFRLPTDVACAALLTFTLGQHPHELILHIRSERRDRTVSYLYRESIISFTSHTTRLGGCPKRTFTMIVYRRQNTRHHKFIKAPFLLYMFTSTPYQTKTLEHHDGVRYLSSSDRGKENCVLRRRHGLGSLQT